MELSYILRALTRFWWVALLIAVLIFAPIYALKGGTTSSYDSNAVLLIAPPSASPLPNTGNNDRYIASQLSVLNSELISNAAAARVDSADNPQAIAKSVQIVASPATDVVTITASAPTAERAQEIAAAVVDAYFEQVQNLLDGVQGSESAALDEQITALEEQLNAVDAQIEAVLKPFLPSGEISESGNYPPVPTADQVAPDLVSAKENILAEYQQLVSARTQLGTTGQLKITSQIIQPASLPTDPLLTSNSTLLAAALVGSLGLGLAAAVVAARLSPWAIDHQEFEELLGERPCGVFPHEVSLRKNRRVALETLPQTVRPFVEMVCVRTETMVKSGGPLAVAVVGSQRSSGTTSLAAAMATEFGMSGSEVLLIDADIRTSELSARFSSGMIGIGDLMLTSDENDPSFDTARPQPTHPESCRSGVQIAGIRSQSDADFLRRGDVRKLVDAARSSARVVVIDGGALLDTVAATHLLDAVDVIVIALPERFQRRADLPILRDEFSVADVQPLVVLMPTPRRPHRQTPPRLDTPKVHEVSAPFESPVIPDRPPAP